jgi:hypothetical protein
MVAVATIIAVADRTDGMHTRAIMEDMRTDAIMEDTRTRATTDDTRTPIIDTTIVGMRSRIIDPMCDTIIDRTPIAIIDPL